MCSFGSCQTRFEFLSQFRKVWNAFECFVAQVQTHLPKTKRVWPMKINVICTVVCVCFSSETTWPNSPMLMPIYRGNNVDLQHTCILNFDLRPSMTAGQGQDILWFCEFWCLMGSSLCSLLLRNYSTDFSNADTNLSSEQCRFATYTSFWPSPLRDCRSMSLNTSILLI